jgi:lipoic acid synthetase
MLGLGEELAEVRAVLGDLRAIGCEIVTIGQYLRPSATHVPLERYVHPEEFDALRREAEGLGFRHVEAGPLVRSSYHAWSHVV